LEVHGRGDCPLTLEPGDLVLIKCRDVVGWLVRLGQALNSDYRVRGYSVFDHVALAISEDCIVEADQKGIHRSPIADYQNTLYVRVNYSGQHLSRRAAVEFATYRAEEGAQGRLRYASVTAVFLAFRVWFRSPFSVVKRNTDTCAQLVTEALAHGGMIFQREPADTLAADLAVEFGVDEETRNAVWARRPQACRRCRAS